MKQNIIGSYFHPLPPLSRAIACLQRLIDYPHFLFCVLFICPLGYSSFCIGLQEIFTE